MTLRVKKCCFCVELPTGAMMLGWATLVFAFSTILLSITGILYAAEIAEHFHKEKLLEHTYEVQTLEKFVIIVCAVIVFGKLINVISAALLLAGTVKHNRLLLVPWLFAELCTTIIMFFFGLLELVQDIEQGTGFISNFLVNILMLGVSIYFWICIFSFYKTLRDEELNTQRSVEPAPVYTATRYEKTGAPPYVTLA